MLAISSRLELPHFLSFLRSQQAGRTTLGKYLCEMRWNQPDATGIKS
jgi:hypothetical protein